MEGIVNIVGVLTALACSILLYRGYLRTSAGLLKWGAFCFLALSIESIIIFFDRFVIIDTELFLIRYSIAIIGLFALIGALIWETD